MITTLAGENSFGLQHELQQRVAAFIEEHGDLALERVDGEEVGIDRIQEALTSLPFLASRKLVVLRSASKNKQFTEQAEQLLGDVPETTDVIIVETKLDKRQSYYKFLKSKTNFTAYDELDSNGLANWLVTAAKAKQGSISSGDARYLVERIGINQQMLSNELEKLLIYNGKITRTTIDLLTDATPQSSIFDLLEAAFSGNAKRALQLYGEQRALKVEAPQIIAMLAWQLHIVATIKAGGDRSADEIARDAKLSPYVVKKSQGIARRVSLKDLKEQINDLLTIDLKSKRTMIDTDEALQHYLLKLAQ